MSTDAAQSGPPGVPGTRLIPEGFASQTEGMATILQRGNEVFYNPAQVVNRDLSIAVLSYFSQRRQEELAAKRRQKGNNRNEGLSILEGLSASGLRAIRYALEIDGVKKVVANDLDPTVVEAMKRNIEFNGAKAQALVQPSCGDARLACIQNAGVFDAIDLDPYGSPSILLDSAVQAVGDGGLLLVTATDMAVLCGNNGEACFAKYGVYPLHKPYCHEMAIRILLSCIDSHAARHKRYIVPILSLSIDFYVRVFVRVYTSAAEVKNSALKKGYLYQSQGCDAYYWQSVGRKQIKGNGFRYTPGAGPTVPEKCPDTGSGYTVGGPFWTEPLHDVDWVKGIIQYIKTRKLKFQANDRLLGLLNGAIEELNDVPLYFNLHDICKTLKCTSPRAEVLRSAIINAGYRVSGSHANPLAVKTDAPWSVIWDIMRCWVADHPVKGHDETSYAYKILAIQPEIKADFSRAPQAVILKKVGKKKRVARFPDNPEKNWGPKPRHGKPLKGPGGAGKGGKAEEGQGGGDANGAGGVNGGKNAAIAAVFAGVQQAQQQQDDGYNSTLS